MRSILARFSCAIAFGAAVGCKSTPREIPATQTRPTVSTQSAGWRWSGEFRPQQQRTGGLGPTGKNRVFGSVRLESLAGDSARSRVQISISTSLSGGQSLPWSVYPGRCGSGSGLTSPLIPPGTLPMLEVVANGKASLNSELALRLPATGTFHLNVFWSTASMDLSAVLACANLTPA